MNPHRVASYIVALMIVCGTSPMRAQDNQGPYSHMAPLEQYLMDRNAEITLAKSAAPEAVSRDAKVLVLGPHGFETAVEGTNGFVCAVLRSFTAAVEDPEFWNPKVRAAQCLNPVAARSVLPFYLKRTEMVLAGMSKAQVIEAQKAAGAKGEFPPVEPGAMCYMMSKDTYLSDQGSHNISHVMFYAPTTDGAGWGADQPNSPVYMVPQDPSAPVSSFMVVVAKWSDGTPVAVKSHDVHN